MAKLSASNRPAPFQRPRIDLDSSVRRDWEPTTWFNLRVGDTVADYGTVRDIRDELDGYRYVFDHKNVWFHADYDSTVQAFVKVNG